MGPQPLLVWTFGGTSLADLTRLRRVAQRMVAAHRAGHQLVTVLSAMASSTDELNAMAYAMSTRPQLRELDALLWSACSKEGIMKSHLFVSDTRHFRTEYQINPYVRVTEQPDLEAAKADHRAIIDAHRALGRRIEYLPPVPGCPDMVYTMKGEVSPGVPWRRNPPRRYAGPRPASTRRRAEAFHHRPVTLLLTQGPR
jgi:hypothetical protein